MGAGIGAIFRAPLGGAVMAAEILYIHDLEVEALIPTLIASIVGYAIYGGVYGYVPIFGDQARLGFDHPVQLLYYALLGVVCGLGGLLYDRSFYGITGLFHRLALPRWLKPALGFAFGVAATVGLVQLQPQQFVTLDELAQKQQALPQSYVGLLTDKDNQPTVLVSSTRHGQRVTVKFLRIVEEKDATPEERAIQEVNMSTYVFNAADLLWALERLTTKNVQKEYYITDCPGILQAAGKKVAAEPVLQPCEAMSINTPLELAAVEEEVRRLGL